MPEDSHPPFAPPAQVCPLPSPKPEPGETFGPIRCPIHPEHIVAVHYTNGDKVYGCPACGNCLGD